MDSAAALDPENYPFFHKVKRSLYIIEELLNDENNSKNPEGESNTDEGGGNRKWANERSNKSKTQNRAVKSGGGVYFSDSFACSKIMKWSFKNNPNAEAFRRSMLPFYLLNDDSGWKHPRYVELSNLS